MSHSPLSYVTSILEDLDLQDCNPSSTPMEEGLQLFMDMGAPAKDSRLYRGIVDSDWAGDRETR
ncbi:hypothetical protein R1flu_017194, partial [Riccia fluitans]